MNVHMNSPFVLYQSKNGSERPRGIWFYSQYDCSRIHTLIQRLQKETVPTPGTYSYAGYCESLRQRNNLDLTNNSQIDQDPKWSDIKKIFWFISP